MKNKNIDLFDSWATIGKDVSMEKGHTPSVNRMLNIIKENHLLNQNNFNFLDLGCGNGWVVRKVLKDYACNLAVGVDGSKNMINNAKKHLDKGIYLNANIDDFQYDQKFDIIFSMETFYYLKNINALLKNIYNNLLNDNGSIIIGIDHYFENKPSLNWDVEYNLDITTLPVYEWKKLFKDNQFKNIEVEFFGKKDEWNGTLILYATKK